MQDGGDWEDVVPGATPPAAAAPAPAGGDDWEDVKPTTSAGSVASDLGKGLGRGVVTGAQDFRELMSRVPLVGQPYVNAFDYAVKSFRPGSTDADEVLKAEAEALRQKQTPEQQAAGLKKWWDQDKGTFGDAWTDWRSYAGGLVESLPEQVLTMGPAMVLAKTTYATKIAAGALPAVAAKSAARAATLAGGLAEGGLGGAQAAREVRDEVNKLPDEVLAQSDAYKELLKSGLDPAAAKTALANDLATRSFVTAGVVTGLFGGMGDRALVKIFTDQVGKATLRKTLGNFAKGALSEGVFEELPQSVGQQLAQNEAVRRADPNKSLMDDVINQGLGGMTLGALQGAGMGAISGAAGRARSAPQAEPAAPEAPGTPTAGDELRAILGEEAPPAGAAAAPATATPRDERSILEDEPQTEQRPDAEEYVSQAMRNLSATSRTANGVLDTSSTPGKSEDMTGVSAQHAATLAKENYEGVIRGLHDNLEQLPTDGPGMAALIDGTAAAVNEGIVQPDKLMRTRDTKIAAQTAAADLPAAHEQFSQELAERLADPNADPVETAAWIEWRSNMIDHFWTDGVGKTSKALAAIPLMRAGLPLPRYPSSREFFSYSPKERVSTSRTEVVINGQKVVDRGIDGQSYLGPAWDRFNAFYHSLVEKPEPQQRAELKDMLARNAPLADIVKHPFVQHAVEANRAAVATGRLEDFNDPEWQAQRRYDFDGQSVQGWDNAVARLTDQAKAFSTAGPVENGRHVVIVLGPPAAGKSTVSEPLARSLHAALVDADEAKKIIPEYRNGLGSSAVHEESSELAKDVFKNLVRDGANIVLPKVGHSYESIKGMVEALKKRGYRVDIAHVAATPEISGRRNIARFLETGRLVEPEYITEVGDKPRDTAYMLKGDVDDFVDADTSKGQFEIVEGSGPLADALRARRNVGWRPAAGAQGTGSGGLGEGSASQLVGEPVVGLQPHRVTDASGRTVEVAPIVVEADSLRTSRDYGYDPELQPRDRDRAASEAQVRKITNELDPERLGYSSEADRGAPIIGSDAMVESGNGRVLALRRVYDQDGPQAKAYRDWLSRQGVNVDAYRNPVIVRQRLTPLTPKERQDFTRAANQSATLAMSAPERALADAKLLDANTMGLIRNPDDIGAVANRPFFRRFVSLLPQVEQGSMADAKGALSAEGITRVRNALLAKAYGDSAVLTRIAESTNDDVRSISNALTAAAPEWARMRADVDAGYVRPDVDVTRDLVEAVSRTAEIRSRGEKLDAFLRQEDAFDRLPDEVAGLMSIFYDPKGRRAASAQRITEALRFYAQEARKVSTEKGLGLDLVPVEASDILRHAAEREWEDVGTDVQKPGSGTGDGTRGPAGGREARGPAIGAGREGSAPRSDIFDPIEEAARAQQPTLDELRIRDNGPTFGQFKGTERTKAGEQHIIPGGERISSAELARRRAAEPMRPKKVQDAIDFGLFGDSPRQTDLVETARAASPEERAAADAAGLGDHIAAIDRAAQQEALNLREQTPTTGEEADNGRAPGPAGQGVRGGAQALPGRTQARRLAKTPAERPGQLSLFGGGTGERPVLDVNAPVPAQPGSEEAPVPGAGTSVTKPPARSGGDRSPRPATPAARGRVEAEQKIAERSRSNYRITPEDQIGVGNARQKIRGNLDAIRLLKTIQDENRMATPAEKAVLVKYVGWGAFAQDMFATHKPEWKAERDTLRTLISEEEYNAAKASTLNAHFTSPDVVRGMWDALTHMGYKGGQAIEPAAGIGHFIGMIPDKAAPKTAWTAVELDPLTGGIAKSLYGGTDVNVHGFETLKRPSNYYDLAISNVPFGDYHLTEKPYGSFPIHDFFFVKSLDKVRPGGVVAFITSRYTMDRVDTGTRNLLGKSADLVGAIRLPGGRKGAFAGNAGTEVTTDIIFLRKKVAGQEFEGAQKWGELKEIETPDGPVKINEYFAEHPNMMLGEMRLQGTMYRDNEPVLVGTAEGIQERIAEAARNMPKGTFLERGTPTPPPISGDEIDGGIKDGSFFLKDGKLYQRREGQGHAHPLGAEDHDRVTRLMGMRDLYNDLLQAQLGGGENAAAQGEHLRERLRATYDDFVRAHGPINKEERTVTNRLDKEGEPVVIVRTPNLAKFRGDPDYWKVASLEAYDPESGKAKRADIQTKDVIAAPKERQINGPSDALSASLNDTGGVDLDHIAQSLNMDSHDDVVRALGDMIYQNPDGRQWETADAYLSGNVVKKLDDARAIAQEDPSYLRNVAALEKAQPEPLATSDIVAQFGAPWVPPEVYQDFLSEIGIRKPRVRQVPVTGEWSFDYSDATRDTQVKYGTNRVEVGKIISAALNNKQVTVYDRGEDKDVVNEKATTEARVKTELLKEAFTGDQDHGIDGWVFQDQARSDQLAAIYNRTYNNLANRKFDGTHLTLPGLNPDFSTRQHRKDAVWRIIQNGNTLLAHVVGSGKTATMIAAGMEEKRLGLVNKPAYVIPNHMLEQFSREFIQAYPNAKILVAAKDEMTRERRKEFLAKVASNDWDGVIITHDAFGRINTSQEFRRQFIQEQLDELERVMLAETAASQDKKSPTVKNLEKAKKKLQDRLTNLMNEDRKDEGTSFEESGIDRLYVDEAHKFKNLQFITRLQRVKGLAQGNSQRAEDLFLKIRYLEQKRPGRSAVFATGTPVSNTMAELWTMQRYLQLDKLRERGLDTFDSWASTFGRVVTNMVLSADGRTFKEEASFSRFVNVPELVSLYSEIADTKTADMLNLPRPEVKTRSGAPGIEIVEAEPSSAEEEHIESLVKLAESLKGKPPKKGEPNMLSVVTAGRKVATDGRLISGDFDFNPQGKIAKAVDNITRIYNEGNADPAAPNKVQMVFLDMGVPQTRSSKKPALKVAQNPDGEWGIKGTGATDGTFGTKQEAEQYIAAQEQPDRVDLYADLKQRLIDKGIPAKEIGAIHDAKDDEKKAKLFAKVRSGEIRVILGSSEKMGVGTNVQDRLIAMHHLDAPWKPADVEQRDGRIVRQGNKNKEVAIYRYVTKRSFDAFMWQKLDTKAKFIGQVLSGTKGSRHAEDIDNPLPEAAEMKAAASGDPRIMEHAELDREVRALTAQRRAFDATKSRANQEVNSGTARIEQYEKALPTAKEDAAKVTDIAGDKFAVELGGTPVNNRLEAGKAILERISKLDPRQLYSPKVVNIGRMSGFEMNMEMRGLWNGEGADLRATPSLRGKVGYGAINDYVINQHTDPAGLIRRFENILAGIKQKPEQLERELARERESVAALRKTLGQTWPREADYRKAITKLDDLSKAMKAPTSPDVAEVKAQRPDNERIVEVAIRDPETGEVSSAKNVNHSDLVEWAAKELGVPFDDVAHWQDGFLTSTGRFVDRAEAMRIAKNQSQVSRGSRNEGLTTDELDRSDKEFLTVKGKQVWAMIMDPIDNSVLGTVSYKRAADNDFHHSFYLPDGLRERVNKGEGILVWADAQGVHAMEPLTPTLRAAAMQHLNPDVKARTGWEEVEGYDRGPKPGERVVQIGRNTTAHVAPIFTREQAKIAAAVREIGERLAPQANIRSVAAVRQHGKQMWGAFVNTEAFPQLVAVSLEGGSVRRIVGTLRHEVIHHFRNAGLIREPEWKALEAKALKDNWMAKYNIADRYPNLSADHQIEEAVAERFKDWRGERSTEKPSLIRDAFNRMDLLLRRVAAAARRFLGKDATAADVFTRIETGEVGRRTSEKIEAQKRYFAERDAAQAPEVQTKTPEFKRWFGKSKVVDGDGKPKVVYHGYAGRQFNAFDPKRLGSRRNNGASREGFFFADQTTAERYAEGAGDDNRNMISETRRYSREFVHDVYLSLQNPARIDGSDLGGNAQSADEMGERLRAAKSAGHDGAIISGWKDGSGSDTQYVAFRPEQIKSATYNHGAFDPENADIRAQTPGGEARERRMLAGGTPATFREKLVASTDALRTRADAFSKTIGLDQVVRDLQMKVAPMAARDATIESRATAKEFMNARRQSRQNWNAADKFVMDNFTPEQRKRMWDAADEQSVAEQQGLPTAGIGLDRLSPAERSVVETLQGVGSRLFNEARSLKMVQSEGLPSYAPRMVVRMVNGKFERGAGEGVEVVRDIRTLALANSRLEDAIAARKLINTIQEVGRATGTQTVNTGGAPTRRIGAEGLAVHAIDQMGRGVSTTTPNLRHRKHLTTAETEAAAAKVKVRDEDAPQWFTLNHPSFQTLEPRLEVNDVTGKVQPVRTQAGDIVFDRKPIYIRSDFEGPLRAVLSKDTDRVYRALMNLKGKAMAVIMMSPLIHNQVEWGRALPAAPGKVLTFQTYLEGNKVANDPAQMRQAISGGVVPIGGHGYMQDIVSMAEAPTLRPGRSLTAAGAGYGAEALGHMTRIYDPRSGADTVRRGVDWMGNHWHNTLLWDRVRDLQMGLWSHIKDAMIAKGFDPYAANVAGAHFANRYAGALPMEAMSGIARGIANVMLFSRSFTLGNLGAFKDAFIGLPRDAQALIQKNVSYAELQRVQKYVKGKSRAMLALDAGLYYATLSALQSAFNTAGVVPTVATLGGMIAGGALGGKGGKYGRLAAAVGGGAAAFALASVLGASPGTKKLEEELEGYWDRFSELLKRAWEHPFEVLGNPVKTIESLSATAENEPTLRGRLMIGYDEDGTAIYARLPAGKVTEEFIGWLSEPLDMIHRKLSTFARPLDQIYHNDAGFGRKVYDPKADTPADVAMNIARISGLIVASQLPIDTLKSAKDWVKGGPGSDVAGLKAASPFLGFTVRKGYPGGPELGIMADAKERHDFKVQKAIPEIRDLIRNGKVEEATAMMQELKIAKGLQGYYIRTTQNPKSRLSKQKMQDFMQYATPEQQQEFSKAQGHAAGGAVKGDESYADWRERIGWASGVRVLARANGGRVDPGNINHEPTEAQKTAGNYAKDHVNIFGLDLTIENAKGSVRRGVGPDGKPWACVLPANYGYIKRTHGQDDDHVDAYLGPHIKSPHVFLVDQHDLRTGKMDEHKAMLGFGSQKQALACYERAFSDGNGRSRIGAVTTMTVPQFKDWLAIESEKRTHASVDYVERSTGAEHCAICKHFIPGNPSACTGVKSPISAAGWCKRFKRA